MNCKQKDVEICLIRRNNWWTFIHFIQSNQIVLTKVARLTVIQTLYAIEISIL